MASNSTMYTSRDDFNELMDHSPSFEESLKACCTEGAYSSIWTIMALSTVVGLPISSFYPPMNGSKCKTHISLTKRFFTEENENRETLNILWSRLGPWRPPTWTGNHFVPVIEIQPEQPQVINSVTEQKRQEKNQPDMTRKSPEIEIQPKQPQEINPVTKQPHQQQQKPDQPNKSSEITTVREPKVHFAPPEISTPLNSHLQKQRENQRQQISTFVITDKSGNEIKVTPMDNLDVTVPGGETESNSIFEPSLIQNCTASEINIEICNDSRTSETSDREYDISDIDSRSDDEHVIPVTETDDTEINVTDQDMSEFDQKLPVPENVKPLPRGKWQTADEIYKLVKQKDYVHSEVPPGDKSNCYMLVNNSRNIERGIVKKHCDFFDDCGVWMSNQGRTLKQHYYIEGDNIFYCELKQGKYCTRKMINKKYTWVPMEPQPSDDKIITMSKYYATLKESPSFQKHVTYVFKAADETLKHTAVFEYRGEQPSSTNYVRTNPKTVDKIKTQVKTKPPKEVYADLKREDSMTCARDFRVVKNIKYQQKRKEKTERVNRLNIADEILEVLGMVNEHPFVQTVIHNKDQVPNVICYTTEQMLDLKHFVRNANNQAIGIDRTFNLGTYYVTTLVYKNQRVIRKENAKETLPEHPIFLGPVMLHKDATYKTYKTFLEHIKTELESDIGAVELRLPEHIEFGTDDEKALTKAIDHVFPSATRVLCTKHMKDNVKHYLQNKVGMEQPIRECVMDKIFGTDGIADANCTIDFEAKSDELKLSLQDRYSTFESYFDKHLKDRLKQYVFEPCRKDNAKRNWTNNNAESINNILKLAVDWKPQCTKDLIEKIYRVTELHFMDYRSALHDAGNYRLTRHEYAYHVNDALWRCKSEEERQQLFMKYLKDCKKRKRAEYITSSDGKFSVVSKAQTVATKVSQRKRPRNERTSKR